MKKIINFLMLFALVSCTDEDASKSALKNSGYSEITFSGYLWFACSDDDMFHTAFSAKNPKGDLVSGVVCCGLLKSCTIRF